MYFQSLFCMPSIFFLFLPQFLTHPLLPSCNFSQPFLIFLNFFMFSFFPMAPHASFMHILTILFVFIAFPFHFLLLFAPLLLTFSPYLNLPPFSPRHTLDKAKIGETSCVYSLKGTCKIKMNPLPNQLCVLLERDLQNQNEPVAMALLATAKDAVEQEQGSSLQPGRTHNSSLDPPLPFQGLATIGSCGQWPSSIPCLDGLGTILPSLVSLASVGSLLGFPTWDYHLQFESSCCRYQYSLSSSESEGGHPFRT